MTGTSHTFRHSGITPTSVAACLMPADFLTTKFRMAALPMAGFHAAAGASTLEEEGTDEHEPSRPTGLIPISRPHPPGCTPPAGIGPAGETKERRLRSS